TITVVNVPPDANAGPDQTVEERARVDLDGRGSRDSDGSIVEWRWTGPLALNDGDTSTPYFTAPITGATKSYTFTLEIKDNGGASDSDNVTIKVIPNEPPDADAGPDQTVREGERVDLDGTGSSDSDGTIAGWKWTGPLALTGSGTSTPYFTAPVTGATKSYTFTLEVTDDDGATDSDKVTIKVVPNEPPDADAGPDQTAKEGERVDLDGTDSSDSDGNIAGWKWTGPVALTGSGTSTPYFTAPTTGATKSYTFTLEVEDNEGATDTDKVTITVEPDTTTTPPPNHSPRPKGTIRDRSVERGKSGGVDVADYFSDPDGDQLTYTAYSSKTTVATVSVTGSRVAFNGIAVGEATITVTASDPDGEEAHQKFKVTVTDPPPPPPTNRAPRVESAIPARSVESGKTVTVRVSSHFSDPDGDALTYAARSSATAVATVSVSGSTVSVKGVAKGRADVTVTARDPGGKTASQSFRVTVTDPPPTNRAPRVESAIPARSVESGKTVPVRVSSHFSDPDGDALTYAARSSATAVATVSVSGSTVSVKGVAKGRADVTVTARDPGGKTASQSFRVTVTDPSPGNRAPVFASAAFERSIPENSPGGTAVGAPVTAADPDGDTLSYALASGGDAALFGIGASTGRITVAAGASLDHESAETHSVSVVATDGTLADTAAVTIRVTDVPPPGRPAKPTVTGGDGQVTATWQAPSNTGPAITGYDVRHRAASASGWTEVSLGVVLEHTVTDLPAGTDHLVQVRAVSPEGAGAWSESGEGATAAAANRAPAFASAAFERSVPEHSPAGTAVGAPVTA
ncbi:MAG: PKD domain-containing protein, partial [Gemmatimonadetes bacterium]|nr:PKD domain-containing protein [Candidatus Palauibacter australiensis]